jgi:cyanobactin maturation PatA/PatG family protease
MSDAGGTALRDLVTPSCGGNKECSCGNGGGECSCGGKAKGPPPIVYALGTIGIDFSSEARRDSFTQALAPEPLLPDRILTFLNDNPFEAESITWTLNVDATPIYAILPAGPFAAQTYERLREALRGQIADGVELVSVPGYIAGSVRLLSGQVVPALIPAIRGLYSWSTQALVQSVLGPRPEDEEENRDFDRKASGLTDFLARIYYDLRNLGITPEERALNYAATNAFQAAEVIRVATEQELDLDTVTVHKSPICRPDSDCYDVELSFFNPNNTNIASRLFRFTVDVSDVIPVSIGTMRSWTRR